jgi:hypothetical protein
MEILKKVLKDKKVTTAIWQIANGIIVILIAVFSEMELTMVSVPVLIALLNMLTKEINKRYL